MMMNCPNVYTPNTFEQLTSHFIFFVIKMFFPQITAYQIRVTTLHGTCYSVHHLLGALELSHTTIPFSFTS